MKILKKFSDFCIFCVILFISKIFSLLNINTASKIGGFIALFIIKHHKSYKTAIKNIEFIMPEISEVDKVKLAENSIKQLGMTAAEFLCIDQITKNNYTDFVETSDLERLKEIYNKYEKIIIVSAHYGNWEIAPKVTNMFEMPFYLVYRHANNSFIDNLINSIRSDYISGSFNKSIKGSRSLISTIKQSKKMILCMLMDQKMNNGIKSIFLGQDAYSSSSAADLSIKYQMPIVMANIERIGFDCKFKINIEELYNDFDISTEELTLKINESMSKWIIKNPYQWMWVHNRWKKWCR